MTYSRLASIPIFALFSTLCFNASGQSVRSTHSGLVYFFDGYVFVGDERLQQKFGRFPEIREGGELRTELGHAEVILTPGVFLRVGENSAIRMLSTSLSDTRVELLRGSAILEVSHEADNPPDKVIYKGWQVRIPQEGVSRIDSNPPQLRVLSGTVEVASDQEPGIVTARRGEILPFASVLVPEQAATPAEDAFSNWAMNRSSAVSEDNTIAAGIIDDPDKIDTSGVALGGGYTYFPSTGIPSMGITSPYGVSFWSPYQTFNPAFNPALNPAYFPGYYPAYPYGYLRQGWPGGTSFRPIGIPPYIVPGRPVGGGTTLPRIPSAPPPRTTPIVAPHAPVPHSPVPHAVRR
jgi:hypothetical protein